MASATEKLCPSRMLKHYMERVKVATAVAIIKSKPEDMTSEAYAIHLSELVLNPLNDPNSEYQKLEELMQALKMNQLNEKDSNSEKSNHPVSNEIWQQCLSTTSSSDPVEFFRRNLQLRYICTSNKNIVNTEDGVKTTASVMTKLFEQLQSDFCVKLSVDSIKQTFENIENIIQLRTDETSNPLISCCLEFVNNVISLILGMKELNMVCLQQRRCLLIELLADLSLLTTPVQHVLMKRVISFMYTLKECATSDDDDDDDNNTYLELENMCYVLHCLQNLLNHGQELDNGGNNEPNKGLLCEMAREWEVAVHDTMMSVGVRFPLFAMYVWRLHALI